MLSRLRSMSARSTTLAVSGVLLAALVIVLSFLPVPYARLTPGPTTDTLGEVAGKQLVTITGTKTYPVKGKLELTTVSISAPDHRMGLLEAISGWISSGVAVVPRENVYETGKSSEAIKEANTQEMALSQKHATHAALTELGIASKTYVVVSQTTDGTPASGKLLIEDRIEKIDGTAVVEPADVRTLVRKHKAGETVTFTVRRDGQALTIPIKTTNVEDAGKVVPFVGIQADRDYVFPFTVKIELEEVGGPSAGLMFALGIIEYLTPEDVTNGAIVAGTGTIDDSGVVGKIGGISMKILGARKSGATVFMVPAGNCREALNSPPKGITLVKVDTLKTALAALTSIRTGKGEVPTC